MQIYLLNLILLHCILILDFECVFLLKIYFNIINKFFISSLGLSKFLKFYFIYVYLTYFSSSIFLFDIVIIKI